MRSARALSASRSSAARPPMPAMRSAKMPTSGFCGPLAGKLDAPMAPGARLGGELALERRLLRAREVARRGRLIGVAAHPLVGEFAEEIASRALRRQRRDSGERQQDDQATQRE